MKQSLLFFLVVLLLCPASLAQNKTQVSLLYPIGNRKLQKRVETHASYVLSEFNLASWERRRPVLPDSIMADEGRADIEGLWNTAPFRCPDAKITTAKLVVRPEGGYEIREIPLLLDTGSEEGVLLLTPSGLVEGLNFGVESQRYTELLREGKGDEIEEWRRQVILRFVEDYRTAYNRRNLPYIRKVFSENALIIIGKVIEVKPESSEYYTKLSETMIQLIRSDKRTYLERLNEIFDSKASLKVEFDDIEIYQHPTIKEIYGVTLLQNWVSTGYSDVGYVFLMIDFKDDTEPIIHVRTWQLERPGTTPLGLGDFDIE